MICDYDIDEEIYRDSLMDAVWFEHCLFSAYSITYLITCSYVKCVAR